MAAVPTKNQKIEALVKLVQKRCRGSGLISPPQRTVLETLMYAALLENATFDKANAVYAVLENYYIDWNEIRVCSVRELADTLTDLPDPEAAAKRVRNALQGIFEKMYTFDLEEMRKKGKALAEHIKSLESMSAGTPYMLQYVAQVALDGHLIPLDEASIRIMRRLNLSHVSNDGMRELCIGLDRVILKKKGLTFAAQLHHFAASYYDVPDSPELLSLLSAIDREAVNRSWASPILTPSPSVQPDAMPAPPPSHEKKTESHANTPTPKMAIPPTAKPKKPPKSVAPVVKPVKKPAKPVKKPVNVESTKRAETTKSPKKSILKNSKKSTGVAKKTQKKASKVSLGKKILPKKPTKPIPSKKKATVKKSPAKPVTVKKPKTVSPSKALRKKKPK